VHDALKMLESSKVLGAPGLMVCAAAFGTPPDSDADAEVSEKVAGVLALEGNDSAMTPEVAARSLMFTSPQRTAGGALPTPGTPAWNRAKDALEAEMALLQQQLAEPSPGGAPKAERDAVEAELARVREQIERLHNPGATPEGGGGRWTSKKDRLKAELSRMRAQLQVAKQARQTMAQVDHPDEDGGGAADVKAELSAMVSKVDAAHGGDEAWLAVEQERLKTELMGQLDKLDAAAPRSGRKATQVPRSDLCLSPGAAEAEATILAARVGNSEVGRGGLSESRTRSSQVRSTQDKLPTLQRPVSDSTRLPSGQVDQGGWGVLAAWRGPGGDDLEANPSDPSPDGCRARAEAAVELLEKTAVAGAASAVLLLVFGIFAPWGFPVWAVALPLAGAYALLRFLNLLPAVLAEDGAPPRALALLSYFLVGIGCLLFAVPSRAPRPAPAPPCPAPRAHSCARGARANCPSARCDSLAGGAGPVGIYSFGLCVARGRAASHHSRLHRPTRGLRGGGGRDPAPDRACRGGGQRLGQRQRGRRSERHCGGQCDPAGDARAAAERRGLDA